MSFYDSEIFISVILPLCIFLARICDVSLSTIRIIYVAKGYKLISSVLGFFQIAIWIIAISKIMENLNNWYYYLAFASGFACGNYIGMLIEEKLAIGSELIRIITKKDASELLISLKDKGYGLTAIKARGSEGKVAVIYTIIKRNNLKEVVNIIKLYNPHALYTIEDIRFTNKPLYHRLKTNINK